MRCDGLAADSRHGSGTRLLLLGAIVASGCNAILGIAPPSDRLLDGGSRHVVTSSGSAAFDSGLGSTSDDGGLDGSAGSSLPAVAHAWAEWPMPNPESTHLANAQTYSVDPAGVVTDQVTHLQWQQAVDKSTYTWADAAARCAQLSIAGKGGFRLPSRIELLSLVDFTRLNPSIDATAFPGAPAERYWSASTYAGAPTHAWGVDFGFAVGLVFQDDVTQACRVRCVR